MFRRIGLTIYVEFFKAFLVILVVCISLYALPVPAQVQAPTTNTQFYSLYQNNTLAPIIETSYNAQFSVMASFSGKDDILPYIQENYPEKADLLINLIDCESGFNNDRCGDSGLSCGVLQYKQATFDFYCKGDRINPKDQIDCALDMIDKGLGPTITGWYNCWRIQNLDRFF